jgi:hypothetical protein
MGGYAHTGVADATVRTMYGTAGQIQDSAFTYLTSPSGTDAMTATAALGMSAYVTGQRFFFLAPSTNTGACTININAIGAKAITKNGTTALTAGDIVNGAVIQIVYDGTEFQLVSPSAASTVSSFNAGTTGLTPSTATTGAVTLAGTLAVSNGGTGLTTLTANNVILGNGTSAVQSVAPGTSGNSLVSNGTTWISSPISQLSTATGLAPSYSARAWVNFSGVSTVTINGSGNIASVVRNSTGDYTVTFTTAMPDANFAAVVSGSDDISNNWNSSRCFVENRYQTSTKVRINGVSAGGSAVDLAVCNLIIMR